MKYTNEEILANIKWFVEDTKQPEVEHVIAFCIGYYGYITKQIWNQIFHLRCLGIIKFASDMK